MLTDLQVWGREGIGHQQIGPVFLGRTQYFDTCREPPVLEHQGCFLVWSGRLDDGPSRDGVGLITAYRRGGAEALQRLVGDYTYILWDPGADRLLVGCDPMRKKSLAYVWLGDALLVSTRVLTLLLDPRVGGQLDEEYLAQTLLGWWNYPPGSTPFAAIRRLQPGEQLILQRGQLTHRIQPLTPQVLPSHWTPAHYYEAFGEVLGQAVADRLAHGRPCAMLSGGLDSTTVAAALLKQRPTLDCFSFVTTQPAFDERAAIDSFLAHYPQIAWHPLDSDQVIALSEPWDALPLLDDPSIACTLPLHLSFLRQAQDFQVVFDGEWGDEVFRENYRDLLKSGALVPFFQVVRHRGQPHVHVWRELILPNLPESWQRTWVRWKRGGQGALPPWFDPGYGNAPGVQRAIKRLLENSRAQDQMQSLTLGMNYPPAPELLFRHYGLESVSPLFDQRVVQFMLGVPPRLQADPAHRKIFLRRAGAGSLPELVRWRPKINYFDPVRTQGLRSPRALALAELVPACEPLAGVIDPVQFNQLLHGLADKADSFTENGLYAVLVLADWYQRVKTAYFPQRLVH